jgi:mannose-6-phosphate isomerase-like protein (cupin superfamily)
MADYSFINFSDIDNSTTTDGVQGFFTRSKLESKDVGVSLFKYDPGYKSKMAHTHKVQEEVYVVIKGSGHILLGQETKELKLWDVIRVSPSVIRAFSAGTEGLEVIAVGGPKPDGGDGERHDAVWPE